jgi:hypothetical protein
MVDVDQLLSKASDAFEAAMALYGGAEWSVDESEGNYTLSRSPSSTGIDSFKVEYYANVAPRTLGRKIFENYSRFTAAVCGETTEYCNLVQQYSDDTCTYHLRLKGVAIVSPREFTTFAAWLDLSETSFAFILTSVPLPGVALSSDAVAGNLEYELHLFDVLAGDSTKTRYVNIALLDPKGSIPSAVANSQITNRGKEIKAIIELASQ